MLLVTIRIRETKMTKAYTIFIIPPIFYLVNL